MSVLETYFVTLLVIAIAFKAFPDLQQFFIRISNYLSSSKAVLQSYKNAYKVDSSNFKYQQFFKVPNPDQRYLIDRVEMLCKKKINF